MTTKIKLVSNVEDLTIIDPQVGEVIVYSGGVWRNGPGGGGAVISGASSANLVSTNTSQFNKVLSSADNTVQKALDTIDEHVHDASVLTLNVTTFTHAIIPASPNPTTVQNGLYYLDKHTHDEWVSLGQMTVTNSTISLAGDRHGLFPKGTLFRDDVLWKYLFVVGESYSNNTTTWTLLGGTGNTLTNGLHYLSYTRAVSPSLDTENYWQNWTPTLTAGNCDLSGYTRARFHINHNTCFVDFVADNKSMSGVAGTTRITLPVPPAYDNSCWPTAHRYQVADGWIECRASLNSGNWVDIYKTMSANWAASEVGVYLRFSGFYEF